MSALLAIDAQEKLNIVGLSFGYMSDISKDDVWKKFEITREMFEHVWELNEHEDTKASRILQTMSFLALTAVTAFGVFVTRQLSVQITLWGSHFDLISVSFIGFVVFVVVGAFVFLEASLRGVEALNENGLNKVRAEEDEKKAFEPQSLFYFKRIAEGRLDQWTSYFDGSVNNLLNKACRDHILETFLLSKKTRTKVKYYKLGKLCFYVAIIFFVVLVVAGCHALA